MARQGFSSVLLLLGLAAAVSVQAAKLDHLGPHSHDQHSQHSEHSEHDQPDQQGEHEGHGQLDQPGDHPAPVTERRQRARPRSSEALPRRLPVPIVRLNHQQRDDGSFQYGYQTGNRIQVGHQTKIESRRSKKMCRHLTDQAVLVSRVG